MLSEDAPTLLRPEAVQPGISRVQGLQQQAGSAWAAGDRSSHARSLTAATQSSGRNVSVWARVSHFDFCAIGISHDVVGATFTEAPHCREGIFHELHEAEPAVLRPGQNCEW
jgi:hypothetical protein